MSDSDLRFLEAERPVPDAPDAAATARARADLLEHAALTSRPRPVPALAVRRPRRIVSPARLVAAALVAAAVIGAVMTVGGSARTPASLEVDRAVAAPLVKLSTKVAQATPPPGDATLVVRHQTYPGGAPAIDGYDLYTDDGQYYYSADRAGLPEAIRSGDIGDGFMARELAAATAALTLPPDQARTRMEDAALDPKLAAMTPAERQQQADAQRRKLLSDPKLSKATREKLLARTARPADPNVIEANHIWTNCLDALIAGAGRQDVRAGVLRLIATMPEVDVTRTPIDGHDALDVTSHAFTDSYQEELLIDAADGTPLKFIGRYPNQTPSVIVTYEVSRVTVADVENGTS